MKTNKKKHNKMFRFISLLIFLLLLFAPLSAVAITEVGETIDDSQYHRPHNVGQQHCTFARDISFTRAELSSLSGTDELQAEVARRADVTIATAARFGHQFVATVGQLEIDQNALQAILDQLKESGDKQLDIVLYIPKDAYDLEPKLYTLDIHVYVKGEVPKPPAEQPTKPTKPTKPTEQTEQSEESTKDNPPGNHTTTGQNGTSENNGQTNNGNYDTINATEDNTSSEANSTPSDDETLTADLSAPILSAQQAIDNEDSGRFFSTSHVVMLMANGFIAVGFALSIGSDVSCIRRINRKR